MNKELKKTNEQIQEKNRQKSKNQINIRFYLLESIFIVLTFLSSITLSHNKIYPKISNYFPAFCNLIPFLMPIYLALFPIIIGVATVVYQLYYNRYTLKDFKDDLKSKFIWLFILSSADLAILIIFWFTKESIPFLFFESFFLSLFLIIYFLVFLARFNKFSIGAYVKQYNNNCVKIINSPSFDFFKVKELLESINVYFTESIEKKENNYILLIIDAKREILCAFIKKERELLLDKKITKEEDNELNNIFVHSFSRDLRYLADNDSSKKVLGSYSKAIINTIQECILCNNFELYENIILNLAKSFHFTNRNDYPLNNFIDIFEITYEKNMDDKDIERKYNQLLEETLLKLYVTIIHEAENLEIEQRISLSNGKIIFLALEVYDDKLFESIFDNYISDIIRTIPFLDKRAAEILVGILGSIYLEIEKKKNEDLYNFITDRIFKLISSSFRSKKEILIEYLGSLFHDLIRNSLFKSSAENHDKIIKIILTCIRFFPESSIFYLPDLRKQLSENKKNVSKVTEISKCIGKIFDGVINIEKYEILHFYLEYLNECILVFSSEERECQDIFINLYKDILIMSIRTDSNIRFEICHSYFDELITKLDNEKELSSNLLETIFSLYDRVGGNLLDTNDYSLQSYFLHYFSELPKNLRIIKNKDQKQKITEILFHFTIEMLESKNEKSLKICSNTLGWYAVSLEDSGDFESYKATVDSAIHMYTLAIEQEYETSTIAFLGTLFIIIGAYATAKKGISYAEYVRDKVNKLEDNHYIKISRELRYFESAYWDSTLQGDAKTAISKFYQQLKIKE